MTEPVENKSSLMKQSAWLMFAKVTGFALSFILPPLTLRYLSQDKVGVYRQVFLIVGNAVSILPLGISASAFYFLNRNPERRKATIANIVFFNFAVGGAACLTLFFFPQILGNLLDSAEMTRLAPLIGFVIWLWIFSTFLETATLANQETRLATAFIILAQLTKTILMVNALIFFATVEAFIYAAIGQAFLQIIVLTVYLNARFPRFWKEFEFGFFREQLYYAIPFGIAGLLYTFQNDVHNYFVYNRFGEASFAIYSTGCFELPLIGMLYEAFGTVLIPRMSELKSQNKQREMFLTTVAAMQRLSFAYFPLFVFLMIVADVFITTLFTEKYAASAPIFRINLLLLPFYCLMLDPLGRAFPAFGKFLLKTRIVLFLFLLTSLYFGIRYFDLRGMIMIVVVAFAVEKVISTAKIINILGLEKKDFRLLKQVGKTAVAASIAGIFLGFFYWFLKDYFLECCLRFSHYLLNLLHIEKVADFIGGSLFLGVCGLLFASIYLTAANNLGVIHEEDKARFTNILRKFTGRSHKNLNLKLETSE